MANKNITNVFEEGTAIDEAVSEAVRKAVLRHKKLGNPIATLRDGKVIWLQPEEIKLEDNPKEGSQ